MDFDRLLPSLLENLEQSSTRYAVIGGFALGILGVPRATIDLDLLVQREDLDEIHALLSRLGYQRTTLTENVSHYRHDEAGLGSIDILHAFRAHSVAMLRRARTYPALEGRRSIRVLEPEDIIGLKVQAMVNDPRRRAQDRADIESLMAAHGRKLEWSRVLEYFELFGLADEGRELEQRFSDAE